MDRHESDKAYRELMAYTPDVRLYVRVAGNLQVGNVLIVIIFGAKNLVRQRPEVGT